ncbi:hypothetical protein P7C70_g3819, partial [Phenoliferia sp. Uapishka_3]
GERRIWDLRDELEEVEARVEARRGGAAGRRGDEYDLDHVRWVKEQIRLAEIEIVVPSASIGPSTPPETSSRSPRVHFQDGGQDPQVPVHPPATSGSIPPIRSNVTTPPPPPAHDALDSVHHVILP